eukprot:203367-Rhodomonas_salina.3
MQCPVLREPMPRPGCGVHVRYEGRTPYCIVLGVCYAKSVTHRGYAASCLHAMQIAVLTWVCCYQAARTFEAEELLGAYPILLRIRYTMPGTDIGYAATRSVRQDGLIFFSDGVCTLESMASYAFAMQCQNHYHPGQ